MFGGRGGVVEPRSTPPTRWLLTPLVLLLMVASVGWFVRDSARRVSAAPRVTLTPPVPGSRTLEQPLDLLLALDESGSTDTSDPRKLRRSEAELTARWMAASTGASGDAMAIAHFTGEVDASTGLLPVRSHLREVLAAIDDPTGGTGGTDIASALAWADELCRQTPQRRNVLVLFTDGQDDRSSYAPGVNTSQCDRVYLLALDADGAFLKTEAKDWRSLPLAGIRRLDHVSAGTVAASLGQIVLDATGARTPSGHPLVQVR